jgi:hypothetical protein
MFTPPAPAPAPETSEQIKELIMSNIELRSQNTALTAENADLKGQIKDLEDQNTNLTYWFIVDIAETFPRWIDESFAASLYMDQRK